MNSSNRNLSYTIWPQALCRLHRAHSDMMLFEVAPLGAVMMFAGEYVSCLMTLKRIHRLS